MDIIHRDIKPENILILNTPDPITGLPIAKLLDFGLSKHAGLGSAAKTFVGQRKGEKLSLLISLSSSSCLLPRDTLLPRS
jgi:serine/threonine protein kinase